VMMPGMSGYELCRKVKSHGKGKNVPVVLLTAHNELSSLIEGLRVGADNFITKPFEPSYLIARVNNVLSDGLTAAQGPSCDPDTGVCLIDNSFIMSLDRKRILDYLVSTFDDYFRTRQRDSERKLAEAKHRSDVADQQEIFLASISNDLKAPISNGKDKIDELLSGQHGKLTAEQAKVLSCVQEENKMTLRLIQKLFQDYCSSVERPVPVIPAEAPAWQSYRAV